VPEISTLVSKVEDVTGDQVRELAAKIFRNNTPSLSAVGQLSHMSTHARIANYFKSR
jgi:predicted Zn-dependent peptidase